MILKIFKRLCNIYDNMILGHVELAQKELGNIIKEQNELDALNSLNLADVVGRSEQFICSQCGKQTTEWLDGMCEDCTLESFTGK